LIPAAESAPHHVERIAGGLVDLLPMHGWHPLVVHFPLGLLLGGAAVDAAGWLSGRPGLRRAGVVLLVAGLALAIPAVLSGLIAYDRVDHSDASHAVMTRHRDLMFVALCLFAALAVWRVALGERAARRLAAAAVYGVLLAASTATLIVGADRGAYLVYHHATGLATDRLRDVLDERTSERDHTEMMTPPRSEGALPSPERTPVQPPTADTTDGRPAPHRDAPGSAPHTH
jgi:uncharacterized membrane protein